MYTESNEGKAAAATAAILNLKRGKSGSKNFPKQKVYANIMNFILCIPKNLSSVLCVSAQKSALPTFCVECNFCIILSLKGKDMLKKKKK